MNDFQSVLAVIRWSDPGQGEGTTEKQQRTAIERDCADLGLPIELWTTDEGRSAFHGKHVSHGDFGDLLAEIDGGAHCGKIVMFHRLDRLTRQGHEVQTALINRVLAGGCAFFTTEKERWCPGERVETGQVLMAIMKAERAYEESLTKSDRAQKSWQFRRDEAREAEARGEKVVIPGVGKPWHRKLRDDRGRVLGYENIPVFARMVARIWELADETGRGADTLTEILNSESVPMFDTGEPWYPSRVGGYLADVAVIGYHQPMKPVVVDGRKKSVPDGPAIRVYDPIISHELYERVRGAAQARLDAKGGRKSSQKMSNLLSGLCRCAECGKSMRFAGSASCGYLMCTGREIAICDNATSIKYAAFEAAVLDEFLHLALDDSAFARGGEVVRLTEHIAERKTAHDMAVTKARGLFGIAATGSELAVTMALEAEAEAEAIKANMDALIVQREAAKGRASAAEHLARVGQVRSKLATDVAARLKVNQAFNTVIESVRFDRAGVGTINVVGNLLRLRIDREGRVIDGHATMTLNEQMLAAVGDANVVRIAKALTTRFARSYEKGEANWEVSDAA